MKDTYLSLPSGGGKITDIESTGFESYHDGYFGFRAYIKFNNGILICYGRFSKASDDSFIEYLTPFISNEYAITIARNNSTYAGTTSNSAIWVRVSSETGFYIRGDISADSSNGIWGNYIAIGTWK